MTILLVTTLCILSAMPQEGNLIENEIQSKESIIIGNKKFTKGTLYGQSVVFSLSGIGKVSAAATTALMINYFNVDELIFTGVAGGGPNINIGDIVIGSEFIQYDLDLTPFFNKCYIYSLNKNVIKSDNNLTSKWKNAAINYLNNNKNQEFDNPKVHIGRIISGDQFIHKKEQIDKIKETLNSIDIYDFSAIEMEGAAVAQICEEFNTPYAIIRAISDKADSEANINFTIFINEIAKNYSIGILKEYLNSNR